MRLSPQRFIVPLLVSLSLSWGVVKCIHFLKKKKEEDDQNVINKKSELNTKEIKIPRESIPLIIGRGGTVIINLQESTNTKITFKDETDVDLPERTCIIKGRQENIKLVEEKIKCILNNQPIIETYETWIPKRTLIKITERGGKLLNHIQNTSDAKLIIDSSPSVTDTDAKKRVIIKGTAEQIANALLEIDDQVLEDKKAWAKAENSSLTRTPRVKTSPQKTTGNVSSETFTKNVNYSTELFGDQENEDFIKVFVCTVENPSQFYIQVISPVNAKLDGLIKEMTDYYESEENRKLHNLEIINVGRIVAVKYIVDNNWYRGEIISDLGDGKYEVYFPDFGDKTDVDQENIFELRTDFLILRLQAIECSMAGIKPLDDEWSTEATLFFTELCAVACWQPRLAKIRGYKERVVACGLTRREGSPIPCMELFIQNGNQLSNIGQELIKRQLAISDGESWSAASSTLSLARRSQEPSSSGSPDPVIEEIDLTETPKSKPKQKIELVDLTSPVKNLATNPSRTFLENERSSPTEINRNNGHPAQKGLPANPFGRGNKTQVLQQNILPAGFESDEDMDSDDFEAY